MFDQMARQDFERATNRASWRRILSWLTGVDNELLPYDEVRARLPIRGQHYTGLHQVPIDKIVGSMGRYNDFDRAFLPKQNRTKDRWISIDKAHYSDVRLPPVELYKIGEIYFVKDGNHRISVARERGQIDIDAYVTEIDVPVKLTPETKMSEIEKKEEQAKFMLETGLYRLRPDADITLTDPIFYGRLREHIATHRWYLGIEQNREVPYEEAAPSWYDNVYLPIVSEIRARRLLKSFPKSTEADLYLWLVEYHKYLREAYSVDDNDLDPAKAEAVKQLVMNIPQKDVKKLIQLVNRTNIPDVIVLNQEREDFLQKTHLLELRPDATLEVTLPGEYDQLRDHIATHRWYLGEHSKKEVPYEEAVTSWYENVYMPIVQVIRDQKMMEGFPDRTETDLYLWIVKHQWQIQELYGGTVPIEQAAEEIAEQYSEEQDESAVMKVVNVIKKVTGQK